MVVKRPTQQKRPKIRGFVGAKKAEAATERSQRLGGARTAKIKTKMALAISSGKRIDVRPMTVVP